MPNVDYAKAIPMFVAENRVFIDQNSHKWLVLHKTASGGTAQDIAHFFANDPAMASVHYVVGQDGTVVQCVQEKDGAGGNCCLETGHASYLPLGVNQNVLTISIEHVDPASDNSTPLTDAQKAASFALVKDVCQRNKIPMRPGDTNGGIIGHCDIAPISRARCPGNYPWQELFSFLGEEQMSIDINSPGVANYFTETAPGWWQCKNGKLLHGEILAFYTKVGGYGLCGVSDLGLPVSNEIALDTKGNTKQHFERGVVFFDPGHVFDNPPGAGRVYKAHLYSGAGVDPAIATLQTELAKTTQAPQQFAALEQMVEVGASALGKHLV